MFSYFANDLLVAVSVNEAKRQGQPLPLRGHRGQVQQKHKQIIGMPDPCRQRFPVYDLEVDEPRPVGHLVIDDIGHGRIRVRPVAAELIAPKLMGAAQLAGGRLEHAPVQCPLSHVVPKAAARQLVGANRARANGKRAKPVAVEHLKTIHFPPLPFFRVAPETDRYVRQAKIQIGRLSNFFAVAIAPFHHYGPAMTELLRDRIDF